MVFLLIIYVPQIETIVVEKIVEKPTVVDRVVKVPVQLRDFSSLQELQNWLVLDDTDSHIYIKCNSDGGAYITGLCEDFALQLQERATSSGYKMSFQVLNEQGYYEHFGKHLSSGRVHALNLAVIGNNVYFVEPQTDEVWLGAYLD